MSKKSFIDLKKHKSIMFVRLGKLGDMMAASSVFRAVRESFPRIKTGLLTLNRSAGLFKYNKDIDRVYTWGILGIAGLAAASRISPWDLLIDLNDDESRRSLMALKIIKHKKSAAFLHRGSDGVYSATIKAPPKDKSHIIERMKVAADFIGAKKGWPGRPVVFLKDERGTADRSAVAVNISAGHSSRYWPIEKWRELLALILGKYKNIKLQIIASPKDNVMAEKLVRSIGDDKVQGRNKTDWDSFLNEIASAGMLISPDTSAIHAACALGVPVVGLYPAAEWNLISWRPYGVKNRVIQSTSADTIVDIKVEDVFSRLLKNQVITSQTC